VYHRKYLQIVKLVATAHSISAKNLHNSTCT